MDARHVDVDPADPVTVELDPVDSEPVDSPVDSELGDSELGDSELGDSELGDSEPAFSVPEGSVPEGSVPAGRVPAESRRAGRAAGPAPAPYGSRREARERALSLLYEADAKDITPGALLGEIPVEPPPYVTSLVAGVGECQRQIDQLIVRYAIDWTIDRMPVIDRTVVRMATFELLHRADVPTGVVISEAVELAKRYSTDESGRFVNGLLASIAAEIRPQAD